jgi:fumarylacetoacetase
MTKLPLHKLCLVPVIEGSDFSIYNLPYGVFKCKNKRASVGVAIGDVVLDMAAVYERGVFKTCLEDNIFLRDSLNDFMALGRPVWKAVRENLQAWLTGDIPGWEHTRVGIDYWPVQQVEMLLPFKVAGYTDFYSGEEHAANVGRMFRSNAEPLLPNWKHLPVAYHGRSSSVVVSGTPIHRPQGQFLNAEGAVIFGPSRKLDYEVELGFVIGTPSKLGIPVSTQNAMDHVFGVVLLNDLSARDIQRWEYQPLGPFLGKNFGTPISAWVVTMEALETFRVKGPDQSVAVLPYLQDDGSHHWDIQLEMVIRTADGKEGMTSQVSSKHLYWSLAQQVAHHTINGCNLATGDILATGTISGKAQEAWGSMLERTFDGTQALELGGFSRTYLEDGDTLLYRGKAERDEIRVGWGTVKTSILKALINANN